MHVAVKLAGQVLRRWVAYVFVLTYFAGPLTILELPGRVLPAAILGIDGDFFIPCFSLGVITNRISQTSEDLNERIDFRGARDGRRPIRPRVPVPPISVISCGPSDAVVYRAGVADNFISACCQVRKKFSKVRIHSLPAIPLFPGPGQPDVLHFSDFAP